MIRKCMTRVGQQSAKRKEVVESIVLRQAHQHFSLLKWIPLILRAKNWYSNMQKLMLARE